MDSGIEKLEPQNFKVEANVNSTTLLVDKLHIEISGSCIVAGGDPKTAIATIDIFYMDPGEGFEIKIPEW